MSYRGGTLRRMRHVLCIILLLPLAMLVAPTAVLAALAVTAVGPASGSVAGGTPLIISGSGFAPGVTVSIGGFAAPAIQLIGTTVITCLSPPHAFGLVDVTVRNPDASTATLPDSFTYTTGATPVPAATTATEFSSGITPSASPFGIVAGPDGNLWFTETAANKIARITTTGTITEFSAGITASSAPEGIALGPDNNFWFTENNSNKIGTITPSGTITEYAAGITAGEHPANIAAGPDGNLWFTESTSGVSPVGKIGQITPGGSITEFSTGLTSNGVPLGITSGPDGNVWFTEFAAFKVGKITPAGTITEVVGTSGKPRGIVMGPDGNLWVAEDTTNKIARITPGGTLTEFPAGTQPFFITAGPDGGVWFTEGSGNKVGRIDPAIGTVSEFAIPTAGSGPRGITTGPDGNLWFAEITGNKIGRLPTPAPAITGMSPTMGTVAGGRTITVTGTNFSPDAVVTLGGKATVPLSHSATQIVARSLPHAAGAVDMRVGNGDGKAGTLAGGYTFTQVTASAIPAVQEFTIPTAFSIPGDIALGPDGNLWFTEAASNKIGKITPAGVVTEFPVGNVGLSHIVAGPDGNLWFTENSTAQIGRINPFTATPTIPGIVQFATPTANSGPNGIAVGPDGNLWFTENSAGQIGRITTGGTITEFPSNRLDHPNGIAAGPDGNLWFGSPGTTRSLITRITPTGVVTEFATGLNASADPSGITAGPDGNLWFTELSANQIGRITPAGTIDEFSTGITASSSPSGIAAGPDGNLWFTEFNASRIGKVTTGGTIAEFPIGAGSGPGGIVTGPDGNIWFTAGGSNMVGVLFIAPPTVTTISPSSGPANTAQPITITGTGFAPGSQVLVGATACASLTIVNPTTITCTAPALPPGTVDVTVVIPGGIAGTKHGYTYGTPNSLPNPEPTSGTPGSPNPLPNTRSTGGTPGPPNPLPPPRP